jgi:cyclopropane fatty-acyl-phospholipid synthase-like methyltransferase
MGWNITDSEKLEDAIINLKLKLVQKIGVRHGMTVVDMGCGQGVFTVSLARAVGKRGKVLAVDFSDEYLAEFMDRLNKHNIKSIVLSAWLLARLLQHYGVHSSTVFRSLGSISLTQASAVFNINP